MNEQPKVVVTDYDYGDLDVERSILEPAADPLSACKPNRKPTSSTRSSIAPRS